MNHKSNGKANKTKKQDLKLESLDQMGNILLDEEKGYCSVKLNPDVYPLEAIQFAAHLLSQDVNIIIDSNTKGFVFIEMFLKDEDKNIKEIFWKFNDSVIGHTVYLIQSDRNREIRETILKRALAKN